MRIKKILLFSLCFITLFSLGFVSKNNANVSAATEGFKYVPTSKGTDATYLDTNIKVEVPTEYVQKTTEFRGVWVSAFAGDIGDFNGSKEDFQSELLTVLDNMERYNLNTIVFHVRTHNDAMYDTNLAPKSSHIANANFHEWDYLTWFIDECHKRGIEFHAWMNPYRISSRTISMNEILNKYSKFFRNPARKAENVLIGDGGAILDPGSPEVQQYLVDVCMEVIKKYDVDAIHFDDYFYMKGIDDKATFEKYHEQYHTNNTEEFRRLQVDKFIEELSKAMYDYNIKNHKAVQLGISPSGVYRNGGYTTEYKYDENGTLVSPLASNSRGYAHYDGPLYSDVKKWIDNEWIDYVVPQLYGSFENKGSRYCDLVDWWSHVVRNKKVNFYPGIGIYKTCDHSDTGWNTKGLKTFESTLLYNQKWDEVKGFCLYQYRTIKNVGQTNADLAHVFNDFLTTKALNPKSQRYNLDIKTPEKVSVYKGNNNYTIKIDPVDSATKYAIYKSDKEIDVNDPTQLLCLRSGKDIITCIDNESRSNINYGVRAINQENTCSDLVVINTKDAKDKIDFPFASFNYLDFAGTVETNAYLNILVGTVTLNAGSNVTYKLYSSYDKQNWELFKEYKDPNVLVSRFRYQFNDELRPVFMKLVVENEFGQLESEILKIDYRHLKAKVVLDYMFNEITNDLKNIFKIK